MKSEVFELLKNISIDPDSGQSINLTEIPTESGVVRHKFKSNTDITVSTDVISFAHTDIIDQFRITRIAEDEKVMTTLIPKSLIEYFIYCGPNVTVNPKGFKRRPMLIDSFVLTISDGFIDNTIISAEFEDEFTVVVWNYEANALEITSNGVVVFVPLTSLRDISFIEASRETNKKFDAIASDIKQAIAPTPGEPEHSCKTEGCPSGCGSSKDTKETPKEAPKERSTAEQSEKQREMFKINKPEKHSVYRFRKN